MKIYLSIQNPASKSKPFILTQTTLIGRSADCDLKLNSDLVSRHHCKIFLTDSVALVNDLGSSNGTFIDGQKLTPKRDTKLTPGCLLSIADVTFRITTDTQDFLDAGSTINLKGIEELLPGNSHNSKSHNVIEIEIPTEPKQSERQVESEKNKSSETITIDEYNPDQKIKQNKSAVQFPEIELTDRMKED
ncbi:MAG: FHA domain-containing protein [Gimesia sp.]